MRSPAKRTARPKSELLPRFTGVPLLSIRVPGLDGPHPVLSLVLETLARNWSLIDEHLAFHLVWIEFGDGDLNPETKALEAAMFLNPELIGCSIDGMFETMQQLADMWIDSGKSRTDPNVDTPADRNVADVLPGRAWSLFEFLDGVLIARHALYASLRRDGSMGIGDAVPRYSETHEDRRMEDRLREYGAKFAAHWFVKLLDSADARRIARCDHCEGYFAYERVRLRTTKRGVFCPRCKGQGSRKRTENSRATRMGSKLDTAAKAWLDWTSRKRAEQRQWVANRVNDAHATTFGRRWVSQNLDKILKRAEALRNAKG